MTEEQEKQQRHRILAFHAAAELAMNELRPGADFIADAAPVLEALRVIAPDMAEKIGRRETIIANARRDGVLVPYALAKALEGLECLIPMPRYGTSAIDPDAPLGTAMLAITKAIKKVEAPNG